MRFFILSTLLFGKSCCQAFVFSPSFWTNLGNSYDKNLCESLSEYSKEILKNDIDKVKCKNGVYSVNFYIQEEDVEECIGEKCTLVHVDDVSDTSPCSQ